MTSVSNSWVDFHEIPCSFPCYQGKEHAHWSDQDALRHHPVPRKSGFLWSLKEPPVFGDNRAGRSGGSRLCVGKGRIAGPKRRPVSGSRKPFPGKFYPHGRRRVRMSTETGSHSWPARTRRGDKGMRKAV